MSVPFSETDPAHVVAELKRRGIIASARDGNLRLAVHFYNHEDDIDHLTAALRALSE